MMKNTGNKAGNSSMNPGMDAIQNRHRKKPPKPKRQHRTPLNDRESAVLKECLRFLNGHESVVYVERRNTGAVKFTDGGFIQFGSPGAADLWCLIRVPLFAMDIIEGEDESVFSEVPVSECKLLTHVEIECKNRTGKGRLSADQKTFKRMCDAAGIPYFVVTSAEDLARHLKNAGLTP